MKREDDTITIPAAKFYALLEVLYYIATYNDTKLPGPVAEHLSFMAKKILKKCGYFE